MNLRAVLLLLGAALCAPLSLFAAPNSRSQKPAASIVCPPVVADLRTGVMQAEPRRKSYPLQCFKSVADAQSNGYALPKAALAQDFSGWYKLKLTGIKDTCDASPIKTGPVLFMQVKDTAAGVFGAFCPTVAEYGGLRATNGFTISGTRELAEDPKASMCNDGKLYEREYIEFSRAVKGSAAYSVKFTQLRSCVSLESGAATCVREFKGVGFAETHPIWPDISENIVEMTSNCAAALKTCVNCHPSLKDLPQITP